MRQVLWAIFSLATTSLCFAVTVPKSALVTSKVSQPLINEQVEIRPLAGYHFNLEAPQNCGKNGSIKKLSRKVICQFHKKGAHAATVSVCDKAKSFCKQEQVTFTVQDTVSATPRFMAEPSTEIKNAMKQRHQKLMGHFQSLSVSEAQKASEAKKATLVYVGTVWCPPCNMTKEFLFPTEKFKTMTKDFLLVSVDGDGSMMNPWRKVTDAYFYPSFVLLSPDFQVVDVLIGYKTSIQFQAWLSQAVANLSDPISQLKARVEQRVDQSLVRRVLDFVAGETAVQKQNQRYLDYLGSIARYTEQNQIIEKLGSENYRRSSIAAKFNSLLFNRMESDLDDKQIAAEKKALLTQYMNLGQRAFVDQEMVEAGLQGLCAGSSIETEDKVQAEACGDWIQNYLGYKAKELVSFEKKLLPSEYLVAKASQSVNLLKYGQMIGVEKSELAVRAQKCLSDWDQAIEQSPLNQQSRAGRIGRLRCFKGGHIEGEGEMLQALIKDYPYEYTFYAKLARNYMKKKDFQSALKVNQKSMDYSYGSTWAASVLQRVSILEALDQKDQALELLNKSIPELSLEASNRKTWYVKAFRDKQSLLQQKTL